MLQEKGGPFGCVIVLADKIIAEGTNLVTSSNDPTAHAEVVAIRKACQVLNKYELTGCDIYCSCEPCPMCLGAIYWARPMRVIFSNTRHEAAEVDFDDELIYKEINTELLKRKIPFIHVPHEEAKKVFEEWRVFPGKKLY